MTKKEQIYYLKLFCSTNERAKSALERTYKIKSKIRECEKEPYLFKQRGPLAIAVKILSIFIIIAVAGAFILVAIATLHSLFRGFSHKGYFWGDSFWFFDTRDNLFGEPNSGGRLFLLDMLTGVLFVSPFSLLISIISLIYLVKQDSEVPSINQRQQNEYEQRLAELPNLKNSLRAAQEEYNTLYKEGERIANLGNIPSSYQDEYYANQFLELMEDGRADTLKEAINLWHQIIDLEDMQMRAQKRHEEMLDAMESHAESIRAETSRAANAAEDAADRARDAAFWNAASTFMIADEIDRQRRTGN